MNEVHVDDHNLTSEYEESSLSQPDGEIAVSGDQNNDAKQTMETDVLTDDERIALEIAATKTQAAFRGYLVTSAAVERNDVHLCHFHTCAHLFSV